MWFARIAAITRVARSSKRNSGLARREGEAPAEPFCLSLISARQEPRPPMTDSAKVAFLFPGQGAQTVGMGAAVCAKVPGARALFDRASSVLGYDLYRLCTEGPAADLDSTVYSQPALFVA